VELVEAVKHHPCSIESLVIKFIGWFAIFGLGGLIYLVNSGKTPEGHIVALVGVVSAAIGGLTGMLTSLARSMGGEPSDPVSVTVENTAQNPVPNQPVEEDPERGIPASGPRRWQEAPPMEENP
jgi:hypothetical protein